MFRNPGIEDQTGKFIWALLTYVFFCTVYSFTNIPYNSLLPEMTPDYNERTNISGFKQGFAVIGTLLGAGLPCRSWRSSPGAPRGSSACRRSSASWPRSPCWSPSSACENRECGKAASGERGQVAQGRLQQPAIPLLLTAWFTNSTAVAIMQTMLIYYYKYIFRDEAGGHPGDDHPAA